MLFKIYVGIDISKLSLDVFIRETQAHKLFKNDSRGFVSLIQWVEKQTEEYLSKQRQISTFLECKKTFLGK